MSLEGQDLTKLDVAIPDADLILAQEIPRGEVGWDTVETDYFFWVTYRSPDLWRGVAVGIAKDKFDCVLRKTSSSRGMWTLLRIKGLGRVVVGAMHAYTGVTTAKYQQAAISFFRACPAKWRHQPLICGIDANEVPSWFATEESGGELGNCSTDLNVLAMEALRLGITPLAPVETDWKLPTHFPRDGTREGRQIDILMCRQLHCAPPRIEGHCRIAVGSDHGGVVCDLMVSHKSVSRWGNDSRPRWVTGELPQKHIVDSDDLIAVAREHSRPRQSEAYEDPQDVKAAIVEARESGDKALWKRVQKARRQARRSWQEKRLTQILNGDWYQYRLLKRERNRKRGWWGRLLQDKSSAALASEVRCHLAGKLSNPFQDDWDELVDMHIDNIKDENEFIPFSKIEMRTELQAMKVNSAVGPDGISVHLLRMIASDDVLGDDLLALINHIVETLQLPHEWGKSFLALLAKKGDP
eukprot:s2862_g6.t1